MTPRQKTFIKGLQGDHSVAPYRAFEQWAEMAFCALAKPLAPTEQADKLEARYMRLVGEVGKEQTHQFAGMLGLMHLDMAESGGGDFLGAVVMSDEVHATNANAGQFFTPPAVCKLMAMMTLGDLKAQLETQPYITVGEPACGAGGMILAVGQVARQQGADVSRIWFDATDISALCYWMCFVQMSVAGLTGVVRHGDTLAWTFYEKMVTVSSVAFLERYGWPGPPGEAQIPIEAIERPTIALGMSPHQLALLPLDSDLRR